MMTDARLICLAFLEIGHALTEPALGGCGALGK